MTTTFDHTQSEIDRAARLLDAATTWKERVDAAPSSALLTYKATGTGIGSVATEIVSGKHTYFVDEPTGLAGDDIAASPVEYILGALISCQVVVYRLYAFALGIQVDDISIEANARLDARKLFGFEEGVRAGFQDIHFDVTVTGPESEERYQELQAAVDAHCPVLDIIANPTPVTGSIRKA
jgi:uncharacterized OsmC-like protein